jgi:hypothetical protein
VLLAAFGLLVLVSMCAGVAVIGLGVGAVATISTPSQTGSTPGESGPKASIDSGLLTSFDQVPPPVLAAAKEGKEIWELRPGLSFSEENGTKLYVILDNGSLSKIVDVVHFKKGSPLLSADERKLEPIKWFDNKLHLKLDPIGSDPEESKTDISWSFSRSSKNRFTVTTTMKIESKIQSITEVRQANVVIDPQVGEGFYQGEHTQHGRFRGRMANCPDWHKTKPLSGGVVPFEG